MSTILHPTVLWAQRKDKLYVTIDVQDCKDPELKVENDEGAKAGKIHFIGLAHSHATGPEEHKYALDLELYDEIDASDVKQAVTDRTITLVIAKKEEGPHWPRLLKAPGKAPRYVKADWDKWVDEDEEDQAVDPMSGMDFSSMGGGFNPMDFASMAGGAGGAGGFDMSKLGDLAAGLGENAGDDSEDSDEEDVPPLEKS